MGHRKLATGLISPAIATSPNCVLQDFYFGPRMAGNNEGRVKLRLSLNSQPASGTTFAFHAIDPTGPGQAPEGYVKWNKRPKNASNFRFKYPYASGTQIVFYFADSPGSDTATVKYIQREASLDACLENALQVVKDALRSDTLPPDLPIAYPRVEWVDGVRYFYFPAEWRFGQGDDTTDGISMAQGGNTVSDPEFEVPAAFTAGRDPAIVAAVPAYADLKPATATSGAASIAGSAFTAGTGAATGLYYADIVMDYEPFYRLLVTKAASQPSADLTIVQTC
jgi:hypothetical protein